MIISITFLCTLQTSCSNSIFQIFAYFLKWRKIEVGITSNFLHSIFVSENVIKIWIDFGAIF